MSMQSRQPAGAPSGGQFAATARPENSTALRDLDTDFPAEPVDLDAWAPGTDERFDTAVAAELRAARARIAELEAQARPASDVETHIRAISEAAGYHPTEGVMPAVLNAITERGEGDDWVIKHLQSDDLGDLYDEHVGPALDRAQEAMRDLVEERTNVDQTIRQLERLTRGVPGDFDHRAAARELYDAWAETDVDALDYEDAWAVLRRHREG